MGKGSLKHPADKLAVLVAVLAVVGLVSATALTYHNSSISASTLSATSCDQTKEIPIAIDNFTKPDSATTDTSKQLTTTMTRLNASAPDVLRCSNICLPVDPGTATAANKDVATWIRNHRPQIGGFLKGWTVGGSPVNVIDNYTGIDSISKKDVMTQSVVLEAVKPKCEGNSSQEYATLQNSSGAAKEFAQNNGYTDYQKKVAEDKAAADAAVAAKKAAANPPPPAAPEIKAVNVPVTKSDNSTNTDSGIVTISMTGKIFETNSTLSQSKAANNGKVGNGMQGAGIVAALSKKYLKDPAATTICTIDRTGAKGIYILTLKMQADFYKTWDKMIYFFSWSPYGSIAAPNRVIPTEVYEVGAPQVGTGNYSKIGNAIKVKFPETVLKGPGGSSRPNTSDWSNLWTHFSHYTGITQLSQCEGGIPTDQLE